MDLSLLVAMLVDLVRIEAPQTYLVDLDRRINRTARAANLGVEGATAIP